MPRRPAIQLAIPQPCHEAWERMTPAGAGRHCASCDKVVVDFTRMTDGELAAWFGARVGQRVCGQLRADQVGRVLLPAARPVQGWWRWAVATLAVLGAGAVAAPSANAQRVSTPVTTVPALRAAGARIELLRAIQVPLRFAKPSRGCTVETIPWGEVKWWKGGITAQFQHLSADQRKAQQAYRNLMEGEESPFPNIRQRR
ncbi:MAG: hypothetical protein H7330_01400 [Hymenobacteraceae bacterium]|nr:hypothetical protein [Hymenobacteraceae bacterium]